MCVTGERGTSPSSYPSAPLPLATPLTDFGVLCTTPRTGALGKSPTPVTTSVML
jgi:hypothetical protein